MAATGWLFSPVFLLSANNLLGDESVLTSPGATFSSFTRDSWGETKKKNTSHWNPIILN